MQLGMIGLGRMGANISRRLMRAGHELVVCDRDDDAVAALADEGAVPAGSIAELVARLERPRTVWVMVPAAVTGRVVDELAALLDPDDIVIDGGNSYYRDDITRAAELAGDGIRYVDIGTSGGVFGLERGYCLMIGGDPHTVSHLDPILRDLAPGESAAAPTPGRTPGGTAQLGYLHCGGHGAGHFVKMVHNGIEYGVMAAYAEGLNVLRHADAGLASENASAEVAPLADPDAYMYELDVAEIAEVWRRGSVVSSWLLDLTAASLAGGADLEEFGGRVSDSGEGRWTIRAAIDEGVPVPVLSTALYQRFSSRGEATYADKLLSAMRSQFGGHAELAGRP